MFSALECFLFYKFSNDNFFSIITLHFFPSHSLFWGWGGGMNSLEISGFFLFRQFQLKINFSTFSFFIIFLF